MGLGWDEPDNPEATPEPEGRVVVRHAADHAFEGADTVHECPNDVETDHGDLGGGGADPGLGVFDSNDVHEVKDEFHDEEVCWEAEEEGWGHAHGQQCCVFFSW